MLRKWFNVRNTVVTLNAFVSKVAKQLARDITLLNSIKGGETVNISKSQNECVIKVGMTRHEILIIIVYEVIILIVSDLVVKLFKHVYRLCNFTNLQMAD